MNTSNNYDNLINKLEEFIRKYYKNQLVKGLIYTVALVFGSYLFITLLEYFAHMGTTARTIFFYGFIGATFFILGKFIAIPLFKLYKIGDRLSHEQAANIIGSHFSSVSDKLLNVLQLKNSEKNVGENVELVQASINQRIEELQPVPFSSAIDLNNNRKYAKYAIVPLLLFFVLLFAAPSWIKDGTSRLVKHNKHFETPAPFTFSIQNPDLKVVQNEDFLLNIKVQGESVPDVVYIKTEDGDYRLDKENNITFSYLFKNVQKSSEFYLHANGFNSTSHTLEALPNPQVMNFSIYLNYPSYLGKVSETVANTGDLIVPSGTRATWSFSTKNTDQLSMAFNDTTLKPERISKNEYRLSKRFRSNASYSFSTSNEFMKSKDSTRYQISVIPDMYPSIDVEQQVDSFVTKQVYFKGIIKDDYGFTQLKFVYKFINSATTLAKTDEVFTENIEFNKQSNQDQFFYYWNLNDVKVESGDNLEYYFEVWDNDGVSGPKSSRSETKLFKAPSLQELAKNAKDKNDKLKKDMEESAEESKELQEDIEETLKRLLDKKEVDFTDKKKIENILDQFKELTEKVNSMEQQNKQNLEQQQEYKEMDPALMEKYEQLQELFEDLLSEEMKEKMMELEELLSEFEKDKVQDMLEDMKMDNEDLEKELDRTLELFKKLELEQRLEELTDNLEDLAKEQEELAEETKDAEKEDMDKLKEEQEKIEEKFDELQKEKEDIEKENEEMEFPDEMEDTAEEEEQIEQDMQDSKEQMDKNNKKKASEKQKDAAEKMQQMAGNMKSKMQQQAQEDNQEDMDALRALLENLIQFSFDQEGLMNELKTINKNNPRYVLLAQEQRKLKEDAQVLEDSLFALSKRVVQIQSIVNKEINAINNNIEKSILLLQDRKIPQARSEQQFVMTSTNNLALMLSEALEQMQQQMAQSMAGNQQCSKPGEKKGPSAGDLKKMQEKLNKQIEELKKGNKPGGKEGDKKGQGGQGGMSESLARMAAQQAAIRQQLQKLNQMQNKDGKKTLGDLEKLAQEMEETETDLVNKRITQETLKRQQDILTRLLEAEKAERERDQDEKRESNEPDEQIYRNPSQFEEYKRLQMREVELLKTVPPSLKTFYKNLVNYYF
ncbi:MAG: DUF4175 domain-containing protein, partial [Bacteroidia bacterium]|nr:DUF4175 domain-containing protein [Bacteroidia bacterium]